jgi:phosphomannomutase
MKELTCFKAYDIRGKFGEELNTEGGIFEFFDEQSAWWFNLLISNTESVVLLNEDAKTEASLAEVKVVNVWGGLKHELV